jgi:hypothetical protein
LCAGRCGVNERSLQDLAVTLGLGKGPDSPGDEP